MVSWTNQDSADVNTLDMCNGNGKCQLDYFLSRPSGGKIILSCKESSWEKKQTENINNHPLRLMPRFPKNSKRTGRQSFKCSHQQQGLY